MLKAMIDVANVKRLAELDDMLQGKVIPNELPKKGIGTLFDRPAPKKGGSSRRRNSCPATKFGLRIPTSSV